jgi:transcriptional regulator with XRE-family HTH domain
MNKERGAVMSRYIENVNLYIEHRKIKQSYISLKSGIEFRKLSRILTGVQEVRETDMEKISQALGQKIEFFLNENFYQEDEMMPDNYEMVFYVGEPNDRQRSFANMLMDFIESADEILSAEDDFKAALTEW